MAYHSESPKPLDVFNQAIGEIISRLFPTTVLRSRSGNRQWFDDRCLRAYDGKQTTYRACCRTRIAELQFIRVDSCLLVLRPRGSMVLQGGHIMNIPEIFLRTPSVYISGNRYCKARSSV